MNGLKQKLKFVIAWFLVCFSFIFVIKNHIKNYIIEKSQLVHAQLNNEGNKENICEPRRSASIACGASVFEICMKLPQWALQVLITLPFPLLYCNIICVSVVLLLKIIIPQRLSLLV